MHAKRTLDVELQRGEEVIPQPPPLAQAAVNDLGCFPSVPYNASFPASIQPQLPYSTQKKKLYFPVHDTQAICAFEGRSGSVHLLGSTQSYTGLHERVGTQWVAGLTDSSRDFLTFCP